MVSGQLANQKHESHKNTESERWKRGIFPENELERMDSISPSKKEGEPRLCSVRALPRELDAVNVHSLLGSSEDTNGCAAAPPGYDGNTSWPKYSDAVEEWRDLTKAEEKRRGPAIAAVYRAKQNSSRSDLTEND